jgi:hypothetical protein
MHRFFQPSDERMAVVSGRISTIVLVLTQTALLVDILYHRFALGLSSKDTQDLRWILLGSVTLYIAVRLVYGAVLPVLSWKVLVGAYVVLAGGLFVVLSLWLGLPDPADWQNTILPVVLGPALIVGAYAALAYWGNKRLEKDISEE